MEGEITIRFGKGGKVDLAVLGIKGTSCKKITERFEKGMGQVIESKTTSEYFEQEQNLGNENQQTIGGGY